VAGSIGRTCMNNSGLSGSAAAAANNTRLGRGQMLARF